MDVDGTVKAEEGPGSGQLMLPTRTPERRWVVAGLLLVMVLASMEATVTSTAMPTIIGDLHGLEHYAWVASIYLLVFDGDDAAVWAVERCLGAEAGADVFDFAVHGGVGAGVDVADDGGVDFVSGDAGAGGGGIMPVVLTVLGDIFTLKERAGIQGYFRRCGGRRVWRGRRWGRFW